MNDQGSGTKKDQYFNFSDFDPKYHEKKHVKYMQEVQWCFVVLFSTYFLPKQMNQNRQCKNVHEVHFSKSKKGPFLDVVFATRVLQNDMFRQALGTESELGSG